MVGAFNSTAVTTAARASTLRWACDENDIIRRISASTWLMASFLVFLVSRRNGVPVFSATVGPLAEPGFDSVGNRIAAKSACSQKSVGCHNYRGGDNQNPERKRGASPIRCRITRPGEAPRFRSGLWLLMQRPVAKACIAVPLLDSVRRRNP